MTRLVDRLVADGLIERSTCSTDARGAEAVLTRAGLERLRAAAGTHLRGIDRYFVSALTTDELNTISRTMRSVSDRAGGASSSEACEPVIDGLPT